MASQRYVPPGTSPPHPPETKALWSPGIFSSSQYIWKQAANCQDIKWLDTPGSKFFVGNWNMGEGLEIKHGFPLIKPAMAITTKTLMKLKGGFLLGDVGSI